MSNEKKPYDVDRELNDILAAFREMEEKTSAKKAAEAPKEEEASSTDTSVIAESLKEIWEEEPRTKTFSLKKSRELFAKETAREEQRKEQQQALDATLKKMTKQLKEKVPAIPYTPAADSPVDQALFDAIMEERSAPVTEEQAVQPSAAEDWLSAQSAEEEEKSALPLFDRRRFSNNAGRVQEKMSAARQNAQQSASKEARKNEKQPREEGQNGDQPKDIKREILEWIRDFAVSFAIVAFIFIFVLKIVSVDGSSMRPTLNDGDRLVVSGLFYTPESGDIVVTNKDNGLNKRLVKRIIAVGGQTIDINQDGVYVNGLLLEEDYILEDTVVLGDYDYPLTVPDGYVFLMGDNRNGSMDSRFQTIGLVKEEDLLGQVLIRLLPINKFGKVE